jgi:hypothetical protein
MGFSAALLNAPPPLWFRARLAGTPKEELECYAAFGRFIAAYALAEAGVHIAARQFSGLPEDKARVIFGGMRLTDLAEKVRKLTARTPQFEEADVLLTQLDVISKERDKFVHRLVEYDSKDGFKVTNRLTVKAVENVDLRTFKIAEIKMMELDCKAIFFRFGILSNQLEETRLAGTEVTLMGLYASWRYTRPQQVHEVKPRPANRQSRKRQRRASRASPPPPPKE